MTSCLRPWAAFVVAAVCFSASLPGCSFLSRPEAPPAVANSGQQPPPPPPPPTLTAAVPADVPTLDPAQANDTESVSAVQLLYEPLFSYDPLGSSLQGLLASGWTWSADGRRLVVDIDPRARFADGVPVTADDVVYSFDRLLSPAGHAPHAASFRALVGFDAYHAGKAAQLPGIRATGARQVEFDLNLPQAFFLNLLALPSAGILEAGPQLAAAALHGDHWWQSQSFGSGPYTLAAWSRGASLRLARSPHYWRDGQVVGGVAEGPFADVVFRVMPDVDQQIRAFQQGQVDLVWPLTAVQHAAAVKAGLSDRLQVAPALSLVYLGFHVTTPPLDDPRVRRAINLALDRTALVEAAGGLGSPAAGVLPPGMPGYDGRIEPFAYDPAAARSLLAAAHATGQHLPLSVVMGPDTAVADAVQSQLAAVGLRVDVRSEAWEAFYRDLDAGRATLFQTSWLADYPDPQDFVFNLWNSASLGSGDPFGYRNALLDALEASADALLDAPSRLAMYGRIQQLLHDDPPLAPEFYGMNAALVQPWLEPRQRALILHPVLAPQLDKLRLSRPSGADAQR